MALSRSEQFLCIPSYPLTNQSKKGVTYFQQLDRAELLCIQKASEDLQQCPYRNLLVITAYFNDNHFDLIEKILNLVVENISKYLQYSIEAVVVCIPYLDHSFYTILSVPQGEILNRMSCLIP